MRVLIFETHAAGHRLHWVRMCTQAIANLGVEIVFATDASVPRTDEFRTHIEPVLDRITLDAFLDTVDMSLSGRSAIDRLRGLRTATKRHRPEHVYVPSADGLVQMTGAARLMGLAGSRRSMELEGILLRGRFAYPRRWDETPFAHLWLLATSLSTIDLLHFLDPIPYERIMKRGGPLAAKAHLIPEPVEPLPNIDRNEARRQLNLPLEGRLVCCPGWLDERKGVDRLIRAFAAMSSRLRPDDRLLLVGYVEPSIRAVLSGARDLVQSGRIILHEGVVSDDHLHQAMAAADFVAATYPRHIGSSGIVVRAAGLGRMVLASDFGWVGMVTKRFGLGMTCDCRDETAIAQLLPTALDASASFRPSEAAKRFSRYHTQANFESHLARRLRQRLGCDGAPETRTWDWVLQAAGPRASARPAVSGADHHV